MVLSVHVNLSCKSDPVIVSSACEDSRSSDEHQRRAQGISVIRRESMPTLCGRLCCIRPRDRYFHNSVRSRTEPGINEPLLDERQRNSGVSVFV